MPTPPTTSAYSDSDGSSEYHEASEYMLPSQHLQQEDLSHSHVEESVTAAEPIEDDHDYLLNDAGIPTICLSSLGEGDGYDEDEDDHYDNLELQDGLAKPRFSSSDEEEHDVDESLQQQDYQQQYQQQPKQESMEDNGLGYVDLEIADAEQQHELNSKKLRANTDPTSHSLSDHMVHEDNSSSRQANRQRLVSHDGVIAEFDANGGHLDDLDSGQGRTSGGNTTIHGDGHDNAVKAVAVEIDDSYCSCCVHDLELGDEEPLPYPGGNRRRHHHHNYHHDHNDHHHPQSSWSGRARASFSRMMPSSWHSPNQQHSHFHDHSGRHDLAAPRSQAIDAATGMYSRPELISATVIKSTPLEPIGLNLVRDESVIIYSISDEEDSLLRNGPFQPGDKVLSINNKRTENMDSNEAARLLREATGFITIVVHNPGGDPCLVESMITKANQNQRSGMGLKSTGTRDLRVSSINENGLFAQSLVNVGDRILSINNSDVTEVDARAACDIIKNSPCHVTVVARTRHTHGVVVAEVSNRGLNTSQSGMSDGVLSAVPELPRRNRRQEIEAIDDWCRMSRQQREQVIIGVCIFIIIVGIMAGVFGRPSDD